MFAMIALVVTPQFRLARQERRSLWPGWLAISVYLLFCHGCHGDEDTELFVLRRVRPPKAFVSSKIEVHSQPILDGWTPPSLARKR
jgi:hypothetical protein